MSMRLNYVDSHSDGQAMQTITPPRVMRILTASSRFGKRTGLTVNVG